MWIYMSTMKYVKAVRDWEAIYFRSTKSSQTFLRGTSFTSLEEAEDNPNDHAKEDQLCQQAQPWAFRRWSYSSICNS